MKILILKHGALGDVVRTSFFAKGLKQKFVGCYIEWVTRVDAYDLIRFNPYIDRVTLVGKNGEFEDGQTLAYQAYDWVISLDDEIQSCKLVREVTHRRLSGSYPTGGKISYTDDVSPWFDMGLLSKFGKRRADDLKLLNKKTHAEIFKEILELGTVEPNFYGDPGAFDRVRKQFRDAFFNVGLNLHAGKRWPSKSLQPPEAIKLIDWLLNANFNCPVRISLLGGSADLQFNQALLSHFTQYTNVELTPPSDLAEFAAIIGSQNLIVTSDSMALHLAVAQKIPNISYYAPTSAAEIETFDSGRKIKSTSPDYCSYRPDADNSSITAERIISEING